MKIIIVCFFFLPIVAYSQDFEVNCGNDTTFCVSINNSAKIYIGSNVKLKN